MCELQGRILGIANDIVTNKVQITFEVDSKTSARRCYEQFKDAKLIDINVSKHREKRSGEANRYLWLLCTKLADERSKDGVFITKEEVYRDEIRDMGVYRDYHDLPLPEAETLKTAWGMLGTGWVTEQVDFSPDGDRVTIRCYYGSSRYTRNQMHKLLKKVVQDCHALGIDTKTPDEIADMISLMEEAEKNGYSKRKVVGC